VCAVSALGSTFASTNGIRLAADTSGTRATRTRPTAFAVTDGRIGEIDAVVDRA